MPADITAREAVRLPLDPMAPDTALRPYLHFADAFRDTNYAVAADIVGAALARTHVRANASGRRAAGGEEGRPTSAAGHFGGGATGLDLGSLRTFEPMSMTVATERPTANRARTGGPADLML